MGKNRALYIGPSHAAGGIPVIVDGVKPVEVEGMEYKICGDAYRSPEKLDFKQKTNLEVLDSIHNDFSCKFDQSKAAGTDFIICKLAVRDLTKHDRYGTVREILDQMQGEVGCKLSDGSLPEPKMKRGGVMSGGFYNQRPLQGYVKWKTWPQFESEYPLMTGIFHGKINIKKGAAFTICQDFTDIEEVIMGRADLFDLSKVSRPQPSELGAIIAKAITLPGNSVDDLKELGAATKIGYDAVRNISTIVEAAKMLGFGAITAYEDEIYPTILFVWDIESVSPLVLNDAHNKRIFDKIGNNLPKYDTGGSIESEEKKDDDAYVSEQIAALKASLGFLDKDDAIAAKEHIKLLSNQLAGEKGGTSYAARVDQNLKQMGSSAAEWRAVPIIGFNTIEVKGKKKEMPIFEFPKGYKEAPSLYKNNSNGTPTCELCGKMPIGTFYWIQNDPKQWTMGVGSECIKHFQQESGKEMQRAQKIEEAKAFDALLRKLALWILAFGYKKYKEGYLSSPVRSGKNQSEWKYLFQDRSEPLVKNYSARFSMWSIYKELFPFQYEDLLAYELSRPVQRYDEQLKKWVVSGPADPKTAQAEADKQLLSWYTRKKDKYIALLQRLNTIFKTQKELCEKEFPQDYQLCSWYDKEGQTLSAELEQMAGDLILKSKQNQAQ